MSKDRSFFAIGFFLEIMTKIFQEPPKSKLVGQSKGLFVYYNFIYSCVLHVINHSAKHLVLNVLMS